MTAVACRPYSRQHRATRRDRRQTVRPGGMASGPVLSGLTHEYYIAASLSAGTPNLIFEPHTVVLSGLAPTREPHLRRSFHAGGQPAHPRSAAVLDTPRGPLVTAHSRWI